MNAKTYTVRESEIERRWFVVDATGVIRSKTLGSDPDKFKRLQEEVDRALAGN